MTQTHLAGPVVDMSHSPQAKLHPVPVGSVALRDTFWQPRRKINRAVTLPTQYQHCEDTGRIDNFRRVSGKVDKPFEGIFFNDSDIYKWLEAAAFSLGEHPEDTDLKQMVDATIREVADAQRPDGYLDTYFSFEKADQRWTDFNLHEMYCMGHMMQAAVAHFRSTGQTSLLDVATRCADYLSATFGPGADQRHGFDGHEEVEMALVELYRTTQQEKYLQLAQYFVDIRGQKPTSRDPYWHYGTGYHQDQVPFRDLHEVIGHAVRMVYYTCGATDIYAETGEEALKEALDAQWDNMTTTRLYLTGGIGSRYEGEAFGKDFELPSDRAYTETCAAIGSVMWNWRLLNITGEAKYADLIEITLYNGFLAGVSLDGQHYFYQNPLQDDGSHRRQPWFGCACCPPNVARLLASLPGYFYSLADSAVFVHLYAASIATLTLPNGGSLILEQTTDYPWDGDITLTIQEAPSDPIALNLRVPEWAGSGTLTINQEEAQTVSPGYAPVSRVWQAGDTVILTLPTLVRQIVSHPYAADPSGRVALMSGPLVYCLEQADNGEVDVRDILVPGTAEFTTEQKADLLGGIETISFAGVVADRSSWSGKLYQERSALSRSVTEQSVPVWVTAIPYYAWANRGPGAMQVWLGRKD